MEHAEDRVAAGSSAGSRGTTWHRWECHKEAHTDPNNYRSRSQHENPIVHAAMLWLGQGPPAPSDVRRTGRTTPQRYGCSPGEGPGMYLGVTVTRQVDERGCGTASETRTTATAAPAPKSAHCQTAKIATGKNSGQAESCPLKWFGHGNPVVSNAVQMPIPTPTGTDATRKIFVTTRLIGYMLPPLSSANHAPNAP